MDKLKKTPLYYWLALVIWPSLKEAFPISELKRRAADIIVSLIISLVALLVYKDVGKISGFGINPRSILIWLGATFVFRFIVNLLIVPPRLYFQTRRDADKYNWNDISIRKKDVFTNKRFWSCYIEIRNRKQYDVGDVIIEMKYIEIDGNPKWYQDKNNENYERPRLAQTSEHGHNWQSSLITTGGLCDFILMDTKKEDGKSYIPLYTPYTYQEGNISGWRAKDSQLMINEYAKGELKISVKIDNQSILGDCIYNFSIGLGKRNPTIRFKKGNISKYLHPKSSNEARN